MKWYQINPDHNPVSPPLEDYETTISVDVLVFGYFNNVERQPFFGIGYTQGYRESTWHVNTSNGAYDIPGDEESVTLLMWASLPDEPAEVPPPEKPLQSADFG